MFDLNISLFLPNMLITMTKYFDWNHIKHVVCGKNMVYLFAGLK